MKIINADVSFKAKACVSASISLKTNFSGLHILSAAYFARRSAIIEKKHKSNIDDELRTKHRAYVTGAIVLSVASLEACINEVFLEAIDRGNLFKSFDRLIPEFLVELWPIVEKKEKTLQKYQVVLTGARKHKFDSGKNPYQDIDKLIILRNALIHYKPEWDTDLKNHKRIEKRLKGCFRINPFSHKNDAFFPKKCLGYGCAAWAVQSSIRFIEDFYKRMGFPPKWDKKSRSQLQTELEV